MALQWSEAKYRRWGTAEVPAFATPDGRSALEPPAWLQGAVRTLHASQQSGLLTLLVSRGSAVAFVQRLVEAAQDGTGRSDLATHMRWCSETSGEARSDRLCRTLLAWLLRDAELLTSDADPRGLPGACATARAVTETGSGRLAGALDLLARHASGGEPARVPLPPAEDATARQALVRRLRTALLLSGDALDVSLAAGFTRPPTFDPALLAWLAPGEEPPPHPDAVRLAARLDREWKRPLLALSFEVARQAGVPPLVALERALDLEVILGVAVTVDGSVWRVDARAARAALSKLPEDQRGALQRAAAERMRDEIEARAGTWAYQPGVGLVSTAADGKRCAILAVPIAHADVLAALLEHETWSGAFDKAQCAALVAGGPTDVALHYSSPDLLSWSVGRLAEAAQHQPGAIVTRWKTLGEPVRRLETARHVVAAVSRERDVLPLGLLTLAGALPADPPRLRELCALLEGDGALDASPAEVDAAWYLRLAARVLQRCSAAQRSAWLRFFGERARELGEGTVVLSPELAQQMYEALPASEREAALASLLRCAPETPGLRAAALGAFLRGGPHRARWEASLPEPSSELLVAALRAQSGPAPTQQPAAPDLRVRFWRYVALRLTSSGFTPEAQARELLRADDLAATWRLLGDWRAQGRDELLLDLWLYGPAGVLRDVELADDVERLVQEAIRRRATPPAQHPNWDPWRLLVQRFVDALAWADAARRSPRETLRKVADDQATFNTAAELGWELYLRGQNPATWAPALWKAMPQERPARLTLLRSLPWPARVPLVDVSQGQFSLDDALSGTE